MTALDLSALRAIAGEATPGEWDMDLLRFGCWQITAPASDGAPGFTRTVADRLQERDAEFIANFNPGVALTLIDRLEAAEAERDALAAKVAAVGALPARWMASIPHESGAFYPEASAHDNALDIAYEACADDLSAALAVTQ